MLIAAMANLAGDQPSTAGQPSSTLAPTPTASNTNPQPLDYSKILKPSTSNTTMHERAATVEPIPLRRATVVNGQPLVKFSEAEVERMNVIEGLQYVVVCKFSYGWPELQELRQIIPAQCRIKGKCNVGFLRDMHVLVRLTL